MNCNILEKHGKKSCIHGTHIVILCLGILFFTAACGQAATIPKTEGIVESLETAPASDASIDPVEGIPALVREQLNQSKGGYFSLQFHDSPSDQDTQSKLKEGNIILLDEVSESIHYAYLPPESLSTLEELLLAGTLKHVESIPNNNKLEAEFQQKVQTDPQKHISVIVQFFEELTPDEQKMLEESLTVSAYSFGPVNFAEGTIVARDIEGVLSLSFVKWMEEQPVNQLFEE